MRTYRSKNYLAQIDNPRNQINVSTAIYDSAMRFYKHAKENKKKGRRMKSPANLIRYFLFLYLSGSRVSEPISFPMATISISHPKVFPWKDLITINKVNLKHFDNDHNHEVIPQNIPIFDIGEKRMWEIVLNGFETTSLSDVYKTILKQNGGERRNGNLSNVISRNFFADMKTSQGEIIHHCGITPHNLRHLRAYNLHIERGLPPQLIQSLFGWKDLKMLTYYVELSRAIQSKAQIEMLKNLGEGTFK